MSRDFEHTIDVATSRAAISLRATVRASFDSDGTMNRWSLALQRNELSRVNRDIFVGLLRAVRRHVEVTGDGIGARWETPERLAIWDQHRHWTLTTKQAKAFEEAILLAIGRFAEQAKPLKPDPLATDTLLNTPISEMTQEQRAAMATPSHALREPKAANDDWRDRRIAELEQRVKELEGYVAFLRQGAKQ